MSLRKTATQDAPHATYEADGWNWKVLKVNAPKKGPRAPYVTWFVAVTSPFTYGRAELGDTYAVDVRAYGVLTQSTPEFNAYLEIK